MLWYFFSRLLIVRQRILPYRAQEFRRWLQLGYECDWRDSAIRSCFVLPKRHYRKHEAPLHCAKVLESDLVYTSRDRRGLALAPAHFL